MVTFNSRITKNGNIKVSKQLRDVLALIPNDCVTVTIDCDDLDELKIPQNILEEAGIAADSVLEVYTEEGRVIVQEAYDD